MDEIRINKYIALCGYASRRKAEELIKAGKVKDNDKIIKELGFIVSESDVVIVDNKKIELNEKKVYYLLL